MKTAEWIANEILVPTMAEDRDDVAEFKRAVELIEQDRREQHEATLSAANLSIARMMRKGNFTPKDVVLANEYVAHGLANCDFESTREDK